MMNLSKLGAWLQEPGVDGHLADEMLAAMAARHEPSYEAVNASFEKLQAAYTAYAAASALEKSESAALAVAVAAVTGETVVMLAQTGALLRPETSSFEVEQLIIGSWEVVGCIRASALTEQAFQEWLEDTGQLEAGQRSPYHAKFRVNGEHIIEVVYTPSE